ncbi:MAG: hypothetical protein ACTSYB_17315 [Candidatus Helarchaeota archaeon]
MKLKVYLEEGEKKKKIEKIKYDDSKTEGKSDIEIYKYIDKILRDEVSDHKKLRGKTWYWYWDMVPGKFEPCITIFIGEKLTTMPVKIKGTEEQLGELKYNMAEILGIPEEEVLKVYEKYLKEQFSDHEKLKGKDWSWEKGNDWNTGVPLIYITINE